MVDTGNWTVENCRKMADKKTMLDKKKFKGDWTEKKVRELVGYYIGELKFMLDEYDKRGNS